MKRLFLLYLITLTVVARGTSQSVHLDFPHFAGKQYYFWAFRGDGKDTIATGKLDSLGKCNLVLPQRLKNFRGMTQWRLTGGGGLDIIFADGENFTVSCSEEQPSQPSYTYEGRLSIVFIPQKGRIPI